MVVLPKILNNLNIDSQASFKKCLLSGQTGQLKIINTDTLKLTFPGYEINGEEIHHDLIVLSNLILDIPQLSIFAKEGIVIKNCIFTGKVIINGRNTTKASEIEIDNSIFLDQLIITGLTKYQNKSISIFHTNIASLYLYNIKATQIILSGCRVFSVSLHKISTYKYDAENNLFKHFEIEDFKPEKVNFDHRQLDLYSIGKRITNTSKNKFKNIPVDINLFYFIPYKTSQELQKNEYDNTLLETIEFVKNSTTVSNDRNQYTQLLYYEVLHAQDKPLNKIFVWLTGGFLKPFRFVLAAILILLFFAGLYMLPIFEFNSSQNGLAHSLAFGEAIYFSGITFTTIGYGDISPIGLARLLAILEGICGISIMSSFLVSLVKKYID